LQYFCKSLLLCKKSLSSAIVNQNGSALIPAAALAHIDLAADEDLDDKEQD